ncbi:ABC transporter substrate-binding protein [Thermogymnomonas acidicola]|uniref:ABC transporter substrate-binding protein n=1 Tax=Thermogymnomonas acidicola TaxID=399579 RepID=UPI001396CCF5|nr:ABC transporter substrate-binding protein [Thermogymnomonas acidicola]
MKNSTFWSIAVVIVVVVVAFSVVGYHYRAPPQPQRGEIVIHDALGGTKFVFQQPLTRIVSLDPSATVTLYALGAYKDLVGGNPPFDYYPPNETLPNVGNSFSVNYEELVNLSPQAVLGYGTTMPSYGYTINNTLDIPFILDNPESFSQIENFTLMLGELTGTESNASKIVDWMNESIDAIDSALSQIHQRYTVFYYLYAPPGDWTAGNGTFLNQIFQYSG